MINTTVGTRQNNLFTNLGVHKGRFGLNGGGGAFWGWPGNGLQYTHPGQLQ